jgi:rSAM/selenodomain-associated transferase 1
MGARMKKIAVAVMCKTPAAGASKTRLSPPLLPAECAAISACFIRDLARTIGELSEAGDVVPYALYTPVGTEPALLQLLPEGFRLTPQCDGDFGARLLQGVADLLKQGYAGAILVNSDSPTLPKEVLRQAVDAVLLGDVVALSPALDGGYTLIGLSRAHARLFQDIPWSTGDVHSATVERARELGLPVKIVQAWYDVDDAQSLQLLSDELSGIRDPFPGSGLRGARADATRVFLSERDVFAGAGS